MNNINYSFIIPHHNTPNLLKRLIDSIPQREDIEIIVVDDNSDEGKKASVCRSDVKTIFISKEDSHWAGHARNIGIQNSVGKWLLFADSDDFYKDDFINILDEYKDDDIDLLFFNIESVDSDTLQPAHRANLYRRLIKQYDGTEKTSNNLLFFSYTPWMRMFNASYIKKYGLRYEETIRANDIFFALQASYFAKSWKVDRRSVYVLTYSNMSLTKSVITKEKYRTLLQTVARIGRLYDYMGYRRWNYKSIRGYFSQSPLKIVYITFRRQPITGLEALLYYIGNWYGIRKKSHYYVDIIKSIKNKQ